jgi:hypothetical protein
MNKVLITIAALSIAAGAVYWFTARTPTLVIMDSFTVEHTGPLKHPCGALTDEESLGQFGITNSVATAIFRTNDFSRRIWLFSSLPIARVTRFNEMIFLVPSNAPSNDKLYFAAVRKVPAVSVKMASPD